MEGCGWDLTNIDHQRGGWLAADNSAAIVYMRMRAVGRVSFEKTKRDASETDEAADGGTPAHGRSTVAGPTGRQGPPGRSPAVGAYEGWVTSCGVCGHLPDSPSALSPSGTSSKPEQARFG